MPSKKISKVSQWLASGKKMSKALPSKKKGEEDEDDQDSNLDLPVCYNQLSENASNTPPPMEGVVLVLFSRQSIHELRQDIPNRNHGNWMKKCITRSPCQHSATPLGTDQCAMPAATHHCTPHSSGARVRDHWREVCMSPLLWIPKCKPMHCKGGTFQGRTVNSIYRADY